MMKKKFFSFFVLFVVLFIASFFGMRYLQSVFKGTTLILGVDIYPRWIGSEAILNGENPYNLETRQQIWQAIYESPETPIGNPFGFYYPPAVAIYFAPLIFFGISVEMAAVIWSAFLFSFWATFVFYKVFGKPIHRKTDLLLIPVLFLSGLFFRPAFSNYILGQFALFSVLLFFLAWRLLRGDKPVLAGIFIALSLIKPSIVLLPILFLFILNIRNFKLILSCAISLAILYLPPTLLIGWWIPSFLQDISQYAIENRVSWFAGDIISLPGILWLLFSCLLAVFGWRTKDDALLLASAFALNAVFIPHSADYDLIVFTGLLVWLGYHWIKSGRWQWLRLSGYLLLVWFPWLSLIIFMQSGDPDSVENWYGFIWKNYPNLLLVIGLLTAWFVTRMSNSANHLLQNDQVVV